MEITSANAETFTKEHPAVPKVFLFTDKKGVPVIFKALSVSLEVLFSFSLSAAADFHRLFLKNKGKVILRYR